MTKSLEKWIAEIQYQALNDNYLVLPRDWVDRIEAENMLNEPESDEKDARLSTKGETK